MALVIQMSQVKIEPAKLLPREYKGKFGSTWGSTSIPQIAHLCKNINHDSLATASWSHHSFSLKRIIFYPFLEFLFFWETVIRSYGMIIQLDILHGWFPNQDRKEKMNDLNHQPLPRDGPTEPHLNRTTLNLNGKTDIISPFTLLRTTKTNVSTCNKKCEGIRPSYSTRYRSNASNHHPI